MEIKKYIGKPYDKYNCFDIVKEFYLDNFNLSLSDYFDGPLPMRKEVQSLIISNKGNFISIDGTPKFGDIVVIRLYGLECHIGVCLGDGTFIHSIRGPGSVMEKLTKYNRMITGYYRHKGKE